MDRAEYMAERHMLRVDLARLTPITSKPDYLSRVADFLRDLALAWEAADDDQRNRLAAELFEAVWIEDGIIVAVTARPDMVPFFELIYDELVKDYFQWRPRRGTNPQLPPVIPYLCSYLTGKPRPRPAGGLSPMTRCPV
jgi:hypothetical protein